MTVDEEQSVLLLRVPAAESAVGEHRRRFDAAAQDGIPAHVTILFPLPAPSRLREVDEESLHAIFRRTPPFDLAGTSTAWFAQRVLYVALEDDAPVRALTAEVAAAFPEHPPYAGAVPLADVVPHLTIGHDAPAPQLRAAEAAVRERLPFSQRIDHAELWAGADGPWRHCRSYPLGGSR